ncbi:MAG TPA: gamma-glutamyl-gamma-aminobutyrate hydrolase family protein [Candidatus Limnocylindrales bacterium]|nr:gamma-glutamyl-gamma-aminobutyrate hydrolase family protein [Candidatus Limnocylindrales bacterium]
MKNGGPPLIGLPTLPIPAGVKPARFGINQAYVRAIAAAGAAPVLIPLLQDQDRLQAIYRRLDGMVFPGGEDVAPQAYREQPINGLNEVEPVRDRVELTLARWAIRDDLPLLGICRGHQLLNVALGGSLYQDLRFQGATDVDHSGKDGRARDALMHRVSLDPQSRLAQLIDETVVEVNSLHHQGVKQAAPGLSITGRSPDGVIEALESPDHRFLITVQWHPEEIASLDWVQRLFSGFVSAAADAAAPRRRV